MYNFQQQVSLCPQPQDTETICNISLYQTPCIYPNVQQKTRHLLAVNRLF